MIRSRLGLKALGTCALVLGLMAVWAGAAQAENTGGTWTYINPTNGTLKTFEGTLHEPTIGGEIEVGSTAILDSKVLGGTLLEYRCKKVTVVEGKLQLGGNLLGTLTFHECETFIAGVLSKNCNPNAGGTHPELIETLKIKGVMLLHKLTTGGVIDKIVLAEPEVGTIFAHVESTEACSIGQSVLIGGKFAIQDAEPTTHKIKHLIKEFPELTHLYVISDTPEHKATITGSAEAFLTGEHLSYKWAGLWN